MRVLLPQVRVGGLASQLIEAASAEPIDLKGALAAVLALADLLGAPEWIVSGLHKVGAVVIAAPKLVAALTANPRPDVRGAFLAMVEMAAAVADTPPWVEAALGALVGGELPEALAVLAPHLDAPKKLYAPLLAAGVGSPLEPLLAQVTARRHALPNAPCPGPS